MMSPRDLLSRVLPLAVSLLALAFIFTRVDLAGAVSQVNARVGAILIPALLLYGAFSLWIEALCLRAVLPKEAGMDLGTAARIKAASYLLNLVHYAAGAGAVGVLIRRRVGLGLADAMGVVMLIVLFDLAMLVVLTAAGVTFVGSERTLVQGGVVIGLGALIVLGLAVLRAPAKMGPIDYLRDLELLRAARTAPPGVLLQLSGLRLVFVSSFIGLVQAALVAFDIHLPLGDVILGVAVVSLVAALPIAVAGLGTGQIALVYVFQAGASEETLLACSLTLSAGLIVLRSLIGIVFAREFTREAFAVAREGEA
jgi:hypothetical protein